MERKNYPITVDQLWKMCVKARKEGKGSKYVLLSNDEEGNGFHECYFALTEAENAIGDYCERPYDLDLKDCVALG